MQNVGFLMTRLICKKSHSGCSDRHVPQEKLKSELQSGLNEILALLGKLALATKQIILIILHLALPT